MSDAANYEDKFDPIDYLRTRLSLSRKERVLFPLQKFHEEFSRLPDSLEILEYGTGPVIMTLISAATHASEITLSEYSPRNREVLRSWLDGTFDSFDWSPYFDHVVRVLEGGSEEDARAREALLRSVVKRVVPCDFTASPIIEEGSEGPYDVVISSGCIDCCSTLSQFGQNLENVSALVKPGGTIMLFLSERNMQRESGPYYVGSESFCIANVVTEYVTERLRSLGFSSLQNSSCAGDPEVMKKFQDEDLLGYMFVTGVSYNNI